MMVELVDVYLELYGDFKKNKADDALKVVLEFVIESLILASGSEGSNLALSLAQGDLPRAKAFILDLINQVSLRVKCQDSFVQTHFQALMSLFTRDLSTLLSDLGLEFLVTFGPSRDPNVIKDLKKLYIGYKQRDSLLIETKKSILYSMVLKTVIAIYTEHSDEKSIRAGDASASEIEKEFA